MEFSCVDVPSTNSYVTAKKIVKPWGGDVSFDMKASGGALLYRILAGNIDEEAGAEALVTDKPLAAGGRATEYENSGMNILWVQIKSAVADTVGSFTMKAQLRRK
jgi:hypothetical protein